MSDRGPRSLRIGDVEITPAVVQAPMAGFSNYAYRCLIRQLGGGGLVTTEMVSARAFTAKDARGEELPERLWGVREETRPVSVQIWDNDPNLLAEVGRRVARDFDASIVDINFGCPAKDISGKAESGAYLLKTPDRIGDIVHQVAVACRPTPVTAKIRLGWTRDTVNAIDVAQAVESAGGAAVTIHGRTASEMYRGHADWNSIAAVKPHLRRIPLIGNGDLREVEDAVAAFDRYGVDGVMIGRAGLGRPWLFAQIAAALAGDPVPPTPSLAERRRILLEQFEMLVGRFGSHKATVLMRKYACNYAHGMPRARSFRDQVSRSSCEADFRRVIDDHFPHSD